MVWPRVVSELREEVPAMKLDTLAIHDVCLNADHLEGPR